MSIRKKQIIRATNHTIGTQLKRGVFPTPRNILWRIRQHVRKYGLGLPTMQFYDVQDHNSVQYEQHNQMLEEIYNDLSVLYKEVIDQTDLLDGYFVQFQNNIGKLNYEIDKTTNELENLLVASDNTNHYVHVVGDNFADLSHIDFINTTAKVADNTVSMSKIGSRLDSRDLSNDTITVAPKNIQGVVEHYTVSGTSITQMVDGYSDSAWQYNIEANMHGTYGCVIRIAPTRSVTTNQIYLKMHTIRPVIIDIRYSPDHGTNWLHLGTGHTDWVYSLDISRITFTHLEITLHKEEPDYYNHDNDTYVYNFGINKLHVSTPEASNMYATRDILQSTDYDVSDVTCDKIAIWTKEKCPPGTQITYEVRANRKWVNISPVNAVNPTHPTIINLENIMMAEPITYIFDEDRSTAEYEVVRYRTQYNRFYLLGKLPREIIKSSVKLYKGVDHWQINTYQGNIMDPNAKELSEATTGAELLDTTYYKVIKGRPGLFPVVHAGDGHTRRYSMMLNAKTAQSISHTNTISNVPIAIYLNRRLVYYGIPKAGDFVQYTLNQGVNYIDVLVHMSTGQTVSTDLAINLNQYSGKLYGHQQALTQTELAQLRHTNPTINETRYALVDDEEGELNIILNHILQGVPFEVEYKYEAHPLAHVALRATLRRDIQYTDTTARLFKYEIRLI